VTTWTLIVILWWSGDAPSHSPFVVPGFGSSAECQRAGAAVTNVAPKGGYAGEQNRAVAVCVPQTPPIDPAKTPVEGRKP